MRIVLAHGSVLINHRKLNISDLLQTNEHIIVVLVLTVGELIHFIALDRLDKLTHFILEINRSNKQHRSDLLIEFDHVFALGVLEPNELTERHLVAIAVTDIGFQ